MAKKKKWLRAKARQKMNTDGILAGLIPWSLKDFQETLKWYIALCLQIPVREWRQIDKGFQFHDDQTDEIQIFKFNQESPMVQLIEYLNERYSSNQAFAHFYRFQKIAEFITQHRAQLIAESWCYEDSDSLATSNRIYAALCVLPYTEQRTDPSTKETERCFAYEEVINKAKKIPLSN